MTVGGPSHDVAADSWQVPATTQRMDRVSGEAHLPQHYLEKPPDGETRARLTDDLLDQAGSSESVDEHADILEAVVLANRGVAESLARRYRGRGIDADDLSQVALEGLVKAVGRFDPSQERDLLSYAVPTIRGELQRHFRDHGWMVRPTRSVQETQWRVNKVTEQLSHSLGRPPTREDVIAELGITTAQYDEAMAASGCFQPTSLDQPVSDDESSVLGDVLADTGEDFEAADARAMLEPLLRRLTPRERRLLHLRFYEDRTQAEIGAEIGVTQTQVSRLLNDVMASLRDQMA
jgi:RNA polymerase sigma-B factor